MVDEFLGWKTRTGDDNHPRVPPSEPTLRFNAYRVAIKYTKEVVKRAIGRTEVIYDGGVLSDIAVEPAKPVTRNPALFSGCFERKLRFPTTSGTGIPYDVGFDLDILLSFELEESIEAAVELDEDSRKVSRKLFHVFD